MLPPYLPGDGGYATPADRGPGWAHGPRQHPGRTHLPALIARAAAWYAEGTQL